MYSSARLGLWCSGITSALHAEGLGFKPRQVQSSWRKFLDHVGESILFEVDINALKEFVIYNAFRSGRVAQWIRRRSSEPKIVGSSPTVVIFQRAFLCSPNHNDGAGFPYNAECDEYPLGLRVSGRLK